MITSLTQLDEADLLRLSAESAHLDAGIVHRCTCGVRICVADELCADCERADKDQAEWAEYCWEEYGVRILG